MPTAVTQQRPAITVERVAASRDELPRLDVAGFIGFVSSGPIHLAIAVESPLQFIEVFGPPLRLAHPDTGIGTDTSWTAALAAAVSAFFANGGRRCWVVGLPDPRRDGTTDQALRAGLDVLGAINEVSLVILPELGRTAGTVVRRPFVAPTIEHTPRPRVDGFRACVRTSTPILTATNTARGDVSISITVDHDLAGTRFVLERRCLSDTMEPQSLRLGLERHSTDRGVPAGQWVYTAHPEVPGACPSSNSVGIGLGESMGLERAPASTAAMQQLVDQWQIVLTDCAARADRLAILQTPHAWPTHDRDRVAALLVDRETRPIVLAHGMLVDPGNLNAAAGRGSDVTCGAIAGAIAARTVRRGAWHPVSGVGLIGVTASAERHGERTDSRINLLADTPRAVTLATQRTLCRDRDLRDVHVRRLIHLLRRMCARLGAELAFEPIDATLKRRIKRTFETALTHVWRQGALAGTQPGDAFRVEFLEHTADDGQLIVELKIAAVAPLRFITVRVRLDQRTGNIAMESDR